jgi:hypothetical protein
MTDTITNKEAALIAEQWHSVITWDDPGVAMYSVTSTGRVHSELHRRRLIEYIDLNAPAARGMDEVGDFPVLLQHATDVEELEALRTWATRFAIS